MERNIDFYKTVAKSSEEVLFKEKNSKFLGQVFSVATEEEAKCMMDTVKKRHPQANHVCYAWQLGVEKIHYRANDDGEPSNSAGMPIYGQIQSFGLTNVLITVTRYFGGTKLGVGGLISAYRSTAKMALENTCIIQKPIEVRFLLRFGYSEMEKVMRVIKQQNVNIHRQQMGLDCEFEISVVKSNSKYVFQLFESRPSISIQKVV